MNRYNGGVLGRNVYGPPAQILSDFRLLVFVSLQPILLNVHRFLGFQRLSVR